MPTVLPMVAAVAALHESWDPAKFGYLSHPEQRYRGWLAGRADDPRAMPLEEFVAEVMHILQSQPSVTEVVVERCKSLRTPASLTRRSTG